MVYYRKTSLLLVMLCNIVTYVKADWVMSYIPHNKTCYTGTNKITMKNLDSSARIV